MGRKKSRKHTPLEGVSELTATQAFLKQQYDMHYADRHRMVRDSGEAEMVNSYIPTQCPFCASKKIKKSGRTNSGVQRYMCGCGKTFLPTTGTIFDGHRISISEWMEYCLNLFRHVSIAVDSWNNKNAFTTSRYWLQKLFITLENVQDSVVLSGEVWLDETFYRVRTGDIVRKDNGDELRGLSQNQLCIGVAMDKTHTLFLVEGTGKPSQKKTAETFKNHIAFGSTLIHDKEAAHKRLVNDLSLVSIAYASSDLKELPDNENPMYPINRVHGILKKFLCAHSGFDRKNLQGFLNLFAFVSNPPVDLLEKVELVVEMGFRNPKLLRYRELFGTDKGSDD